LVVFVTEKELEWMEFSCEMKLLVVEYLVNNAGFVFFENLTIIVKIIKFVKMIYEMTQSHKALCKKAGKIATQNV
jgi:hypothetical protein